jgi:hypothetical protein
MDLLMPVIASDFVVSSGARILVAIHLSHELQLLSAIGKRISVAVNNQCCEQ